MYSRQKSSLGCSTDPWSEESEGRMITLLGDRREQILSDHYEKLNARILDVRERYAVNIRRTDCAADAYLLLYNGLIPVQKAILSAASPFFRKIFEETPHNPFEKQLISVPEVSATVLLPLIQLLYNQKVKLPNNDEIIEIRSVAKMFELDMGQALHVTDYTGRVLKRYEEPSFVSPHLMWHKNAPRTNTYGDLFSRMWKNMTAPDLPRGGVRTATVTSKENSRSNSSAKGSSFRTSGAFTLQEKCSKEARSKVKTETNSIQTSSSTQESGLKSGGFRFTCTPPRNRFGSISSTATQSVSDQVYPKSLLPGSLTRTSRFGEPNQNHLIRISSYPGNLDMSTNQRLPIPRVCEMTDKSLEETKSENDVTDTESRGSGDEEEDGHGSDEDSTQVDLKSDHDPFFLYDAERSYNSPTPPSPRSLSSGDEASLPSRSPRSLSSGDAASLPSLHSPPEQDENSPDSPGHFSNEEKSPTCGKPATESEDGDKSSDASVLILEDDDLPPVSKKPCMENLISRNSCDLGCETHPNHFPVPSIFPSNVLTNFRSNSHVWSSTDESAGDHESKNPVPLKDTNTKDKYPPSTRKRNLDVQPVKANRKSNYKRRKFSKGILSGRTTKLSRESRDQQDIIYDGVTVCQLCAKDKSSIERALKCIRRHDFYRCTICLALRSSKVLLDLHTENHLFGDEMSLRVECPFCGIVLHVRMIHNHVLSYHLNCSVSAYADIHKKRIRDDDDYSHSSDYSFDEDDPAPAPVIEPPAEPELEEPAPAEPEPSGAAPAGPED